ncbi:MAG: DUF3788 family protein [Anaerolineaceae bacterium]|nr:DUF3788 family protein [Anaerolineaceae bacterium]
MPSERMLDKTHMPAENEVVAFIGQPAGEYWSALEQFVCETYDLRPEWKFEGARSGWTLYCRKSGRALLNLSPDSEGFTALVVLGAKEAAKALAEVERFGPNVRERLETAQVFHDGRWLWIRVQDSRDVEDIQHLLLIKKSPARKRTS